MARSSSHEQWRRDLSVAALGRFRFAAFALLFAVAIYGLSIVADGLGDAPLFLLVVPLALGAAAYGVKGGVGFGLLATALATAWWLQNGQPDGIPWLASRAGACLFAGAVLGQLGAARDVLVRQIEQHAELSLDLIVTADFDGYFTRVNPAFTRVLGYAPEELLCKPFLDFVHPDDREATVAAAAQQTEAGQEVLNFQNRYRTKDGSYRWLEWTSRPDAEGKALIAVARDISDRKLLEDREHRHQELLEQAVRERTSELEQAHRETLRMLALAAEYRDDETQKHTERVSNTAALIAAALDLDPREISLIREAARLHDIGKVAVSDATLLKPGKLSPAEFDEIKRHPDIGASILAASTYDVLETAAEIARSHHEWWDGTGYPDGTAGDDIPLCARIVALADVFDALTHARPYKQAWPVADAVAEIRRLRARQFDPTLVDAFDTLDPQRLAEGRDASEPVRGIDHAAVRTAA